MFSKIHNSSKDQKLWPTAGRSAFMGAIAIAVVAWSAPANAHCLRHIYNNSNSVWHFEIKNQPSNNVVDRDIQPGESSSYWIVTDDMAREVQLRRQNPRAESEAGSWVATILGDSCYINHINGSYPQGWVADHAGAVVYNEPASGDITILRATYPEHERGE